MSGLKVKNYPMIRQLFKIPAGCYVACSGGADSMAVLDFLRKSGKARGALYFDHKTPQSEQFLDVVKDYCAANQLEFISKVIDEEKDEGSWESYWSKHRNAFFKMFDDPVVTAHNLDDAVEWWIYTSLKGNPRIMPSSNGNVIRPFLTTKKSDLKRWVDLKNVRYIEDETNKNTKFMRNFIRHNLVEKCQVVNPGLYKTIFKKIRERENDVLKNR